MVIDISRQAQHSLLKLLGGSPAVGLLGPRQVGKTTLAHAISGESPQGAVYLDLELPSDLAKLSDPEIYLAGQESKLVILDEIQRLPGIFATLRGIIDQRRRKGRRNGQFLLLGSASIELLKQSAESLAGRIAYLELTPFLLGEVDDLTRLWVRGGFPESYLATDDESSLAWRRAFIRTYLERDVPALGPRVPAETLRRFWQMLAHNQGQLLNAAKLASALGVSGQSVARYLDILVDLLLVRRLQPWLNNEGKRVVRAPKVYVRDSGLVHALLEIGGLDPLLGHPVAGASWEGLIIENILAYAPQAARPWFYRTSNGADIDLLLELGPRKRWAIEVKRSLAKPHPSRGFHTACEDVKATRRIVIYPGTESYRLDSVTEVMPLDALLRSRFE